MRDTIERILRNYRTYRESKPFGGPHEIGQLFTSLREEFDQIPAISNNSNLVVKSSYGKGNWAAVPWLAVLDTRETSSTQDGTYFVLLFSEDGQHCQIKIAQGVTEVQRQFKRGAFAELERRADRIREMILTSEFEEFLPGSNSINLGEGSKARAYDASSILSREYAIDNLPTDQQLEADVTKLLSAYQRYIELKRNQVNDAQPQYEAQVVQRVWAISAGEGGRLWDDFVKNGHVAIGWEQITDLSQFHSQQAIYDELSHYLGGNPTNDALCCYQFAHEIAVGDIVVAKAGRKKIYGMGRVTSDYFWDQSQPAFKHRRSVEWLKSDPTEFPGTGTAIKTLTEITQYPTFMELVNDYLDIEVEATGDDPDEDAAEYEEFTVQTILDQGSFLEKDEIERLLDRLRIKKNLILQGPPGTGKTWLAKKLGFALLGQKNPSRIKVVQFHANITYEDFVRGYRPTSEGKLALVDGAFMEAIEDARNSSQPYIVVIEEVNRGNPAQILGEMLTLLEADKRKKQEALELTYKRRPDERVHIPENLYVIGTMNIADRSLALVDLALRRRFAFVDLVPQLNNAWRDWLANRFNFPRDIIAQIEATMTALNEAISKDERLGPQFRVGHSYVTPPVDSDITDPKRWFMDVVETEIAPLLQEYWFDDPQSAEKAKKELLSGL